MPKRTAIIDIGSNSARLVIFEKTSRYGFNLICEQKSKVRIGEGAYAKEGHLQPTGIKRAFLALKSFLATIDKYDVDKTLCVATSALRDAPNAQEFVRWIHKELGLQIEVIDGNHEARYGGLAAVNLLPIKEGISIDIGGGSADMSLILDGHIVDTYSLNLGTVRLKELFFDKTPNPLLANEKAKAFIYNEISKLPEHFKHPVAIGIGGTARTLSKAIMKESGYALDKLHAFSYELNEHKAYLDSIAVSSAKNLKHFALQKNRYDTIREGTLIFNEILTHIGCERVISSSVGVREGVFLDQFLKDENKKFPETINPSIISILDRFKPLIHIEKHRKIKHKLASDLYAVLQPEIQDNMCFEGELHHALLLSNIGKTLTVYKAHQHAFYIAIQELNYGFTHKQIVLISSLLRMHGVELIHKPLFEQYKALLPEKETMLWLSFIYTLTVFLHEASNSATIEFSYSNKTLRIVSDKPLSLAKESIKSLEKPIALAIVVVDKSTIPKNEKLGI